jgi:hypothetical protein
MALMTANGWNWLREDALMLAVLSSIITEAEVKFRPLLTSVLHEGQHPWAPHGDLVLLVL